VLVVLDLVLLGHQPFANFKRNGGRLLRYVVGEVQIDGLGVLIEFFDFGGCVFKLALDFLKLVGGLDKKGLVAFDIVSHGFEDPVDPFNSKLLLNEGSFLLTQLIEHTYLHFFYFIHDSTPNCIAARYDRRHPINVHLNLDIRQHFLILYFYHSESFLIFGLTDSEFGAELVKRGIGRF